MDQLESQFKGFLDQIKVRMTKKQYIFANVFLDHDSRISYVHLHINLTSEETLKANQSFEAYGKKQLVTIRHYHADKGGLTDNDLMNSVNTQ